MLDNFESCNKSESEPQYGCRVGITRISQGEMASIRRELEGYGTKRLKKDDREIFAKNLGNLISDMGKRVERSLFKKAFGKESETLYKKKKTLVLKPGTDVKGSMRARPTEYLRLVDAIAETHPYVLSKFLKREDKQLWVLSMVISDTSFDSNRSLINKYETEIFIKMNMLIKAITNEVDLDGMHIWLTRSNGLHHQMTTDCISYGADYCPCVTVADVYSRLPAGRSLTIDIDAEEYENHVKCLTKNMTSEYQTMKGIKISLQTFINAGISEFIRRHLLDKYADDGQSFAGRDTECFDGTRDLFYELPRAENHFTRNEQLICRTVIQLEIRFDDVENKWTPRLFWRAHEAGYFECNLYYHSDEDWDNSDFANNEIKFVVGTGNGLTYLAVDGGKSTSETGKATRRFHILEIEQGDHKLLDQLEDIPLGKMPLTRSAYWNHYEEITRRDISRENYDDFLMKPLMDENHRVIPITKSKLYVPAADESLAKWILQNLAYTEPRDNIKSLLISDATEKYKRLRKQADKAENDYRIAINKVFEVET
jgi:hypothetical protein